MARGSGSPRDLPLDGAQVQVEDKQRQDGLSVFGPQEHCEALGIERVDEAVHRAPHRGEVWVVLRHAQEALDTLAAPGAEQLGSG
jgi:hypothetical protein